MTFLQVDITFNIGINGTKFTRCRPFLYKSAKNRQSHTHTRTITHMVQSHITLHATCCMEHTNY